MQVEDLDHWASLALLSEGIKTPFSIRSYCFPEQIAFIEDPKRNKTAVCSRRAGKTIACAADLIDTALKFTGVVCLYITLKRTNAKRIIWPELLKINRYFSLGGIPNISELSLTFPNQSVIYCTGAKDASEIENFRGLPIKKAYIDEVQHFRSYIESLIDDVLSKALFDYAGTVCLIGTPGMMPTGYFYNCTQSKSWSHHHWTMFNNPYLEKKSGMSVDALIDADCERMGVLRTHPKIQRECFGKWIADPDSLIFKYDKGRNHYESLPEMAGVWEYVIGVDIGHDDADAIAVIGWHPKIKEAYLVEELIVAKQGITELADQIEERMERYDPLKIVMDTGGLGKKIAVEIQRRRQIPIEAAEKSRKIEFIEFLNDAMRTRHLYAKENSAFAQDCFLIEKDKDKSTSDKTVISDKYHSDICDAVLYAFRESLHWLSEPAPPPILPNTDAWYSKEIEEMEVVAEKQSKANNTDDNWPDMGLDDGL